MQSRSPILHPEKECECINKSAKVFLKFKNTQSYIYTYINTGNWLYGYRPYRSSVFLKLSLSNSSFFRSFVNLSNSVLLMNKEHWYPALMH